jgi:citrate lyase subunit beta / citryl-CoA lyase
MTLRLRRSELSTPGSSERMMAKAAASPADLVFLDLEDSVAPSEKPAAREKVIEALTGLDWGRKTRAIRINSVETPYAHEDIIAVVEGARESLDLIIIPKVKTGRDVWWVDVLLTQLEAKLKMAKRIALEVLIEEAEALEKAPRIARSSSRLEALIFGPGDLSASLGMRIESIGAMGGYSGDLWHYARTRIIAAARAAGIEAVDGPYANFSNAEGYRRECQRSALLGAVGKWAIHPSQIEIANEVYSPAHEEVERARKVTAAYDEALKKGLGAVAVDGQMVDAASVRILRNVVARADLLGMP